MRPCTWLWIAVLAGCHGSGEISRDGRLPGTEAQVPPGNDALPPKLDWGLLPPVSELDILFVVDNSNSMEQEQKTLVRNFSTLLDGLQNPFGKLTPSLHIGVISTDLGAGNYSLPSCEVAGGDGGKLQNLPRQAGCRAPTQPWISYVDGVTNIPGGSPDGVQAVKDAFACIAPIGTGGCGFEHQLEAARRALQGCGPPSYNCSVNPGFIRKDAYLAIVVVSDEDDCSGQKPQLFDPSQQGLTDPLGPLTSFRCFEFGIQCDVNGRQPGSRTGCRPGFDFLYKVEDYASSFAALKPPGRVFFHVIAGPTQPVVVGVEGANPVLKASCQSQNGIAVPAIRLKAVATSFGAHGSFNRGLDSTGREVEVNICATDYAPAMRLLGAQLSAIGR